MKRRMLMFALATGLLTICFAFNASAQSKWSAPDAAKSKKNPVANNAEALATGKTLWGTHCKSCHGTKGLGDGTKAAQLKTEPGDFSKAETQSQTDGALFYKISEGKEDMPSFKKKVPDEEDRWALVHFIRTMKK